MCNAVSISCFPKSDDPLKVAHVHQDLFHRRQNLLSGLWRLLTYVWRGRNNHNTDMKWFLKHRNEWKCVLKWWTCSQNWGLTVCRLPNCLGISLESFEPFWCKIWTFNGLCKVLGFHICFIKDSGFWGCDTVAGFFF